MSLIAFARVFNFSTFTPSLREDKEDRDKGGRKQEWQSGKDRQMSGQSQYPPHTLAREKNLATPLTQSFAFTQNRVLPLATYHGFKAEKFKALGEVNYTRGNTVL